MALVVCPSLASPRFSFCHFSPKGRARPPAEQLGTFLAARFESKCQAVRGIHCRSGTGQLRLRQKHAPSLQRQMRTHKGRARAGPTEGVDLIETAEAASETEALTALKEAATILAGLDAEFFKNLPQDLQADAKFSGFQLANGPLDREVGDSAAAVLGSLGRAFESLDARAAAAAARGLADAAAALPPKSSERARFGRRLGSFAGPLRSGDCEELKQVARALSAAGKSIAEGAEEKPVPPPSPETKVLKFGNLQVELTRTKAFGGVAVAFVFGFLCARLTAGLQSIEPDSLQYANDSALALAQSLRTTLLAAGWSCTAMSAFSAVGLLALGLQMRAGGEDSQSG